MKVMLSVILAASLVLGGIMLVGPAESGEVMPRVNALMPHAPIRINSDADFNATNGVTGGNGTIWAPWVIENLDIDGAGIGYCVHIGNTTEHYILANCSIYGADMTTFGGEGFGRGLNLLNTTNGLIVNNTIYSNVRDGLSLRDTNFCNISSNNVTLNEYGISINLSSNITVFSNNATNNDNWGILDYLSSNDSFVGNYMEGNGERGFLLSYTVNANLSNNVMVNEGIDFQYGEVNHWSSHNISVSNTVNGKPVIYTKNQNSKTITMGAGQIIVANSTNIKIENQKVNNTTIGILVAYSGSIQISNNTVFGNNKDGIGIYESSNVTVINITANSNGQHGILFGGIDSHLSNNTCSFNADAGLSLVGVGSKNNMVDNNTFNFNEHGIYELGIMAIDNNSFVFNNISGNTGFGISLLATNANLVSNNILMNNAEGLKFYWSANNTIIHNTIINNAIQAVDDDRMNFWDNGYPSGGNYWSDYTGPDNNYDGIGDVPYYIDADTRDNYPLMAPWTAPLAGDFEPPFALSSTPNGTAVSVYTPIVITWNETMNWTSVEAAFEYTDGTTNWTSANGTWAHVGNVSTFTPALPFAYEIHYVVTVNSSAADPIGNMLDQNRNGTGGEWPADILTWSFTTDDDAPYVVSTQPADGQIGVDPFKPFKIIFSEAMNRTGVELAFSFTNGTGEWNVTNGVGYWNALFTEFTFSPSTALETNTTFQAHLNRTLAKDLGGKWLKYGDYSWSFTTWQQPPAPKITSTYPPDGSFNVNVNTYINIAFDNEMDPVSVENAFSYTDGTSVWTVADGMIDWFSENTLFSFQPTVAFDFETEYVVKVSSIATSIYGVGLDGNGNGIPELNDNYTFMFTTTVEPPKVVSHYPGLRQMDLPTDLAAIQINFSKVMNLPSVTSAISISPNIPFTTSFYGGGRNLTIVLTGTLLEGTEYRVTVLGTAMDISGIKLDGNGDGWPGDRFSFNFFTKGVVVPTNPTITAIFPLNNATIPVEAFFVAVTFSVPMNRTSVENAFTFKNASATINGTIQWSASNKSFRFTPTEALAYNTTYTVNLAGTAKSMEGLAMGNSSSWQYITEPAEDAPPMMDWILYGVILILLALTVILYMANKSLRRDLKRTRVKLKRLKREMGIKDDVPEKPDEVEKSAVHPEEEFPEKIVPEPDNENAPEK